MDQLERLRTFVAIADAGSLIGGARKRRLSAPTVTRALAGLEAHLGVRLIVRTTRALHLTEEGEAYLTSVRRALAAVDDAEATVTGRRARPEGLLAVTAPELFGERHVAPLLFEFLDAHPQVSARGLFTNRVVNLVDEGFDVALRIGSLPDSALTAVPLGAMRVVWVAAPSYLARVRPPRTRAELDEHAWVGLSIEGQEQLDPERRGRGRRARGAARQRLLVNKNSVKVAAVVAGQGVARALAYQVEDEVRDGRLRLLLTRDEPSPVPVQLVYPEGRAASAKVREFVHFAAPRLRALPILRGLGPAPASSRAARRGAGQGASGEGASGQGASRQGSKR